MKINIQMKTKIYSTWNEKWLYIALQVLHSDTISAAKWEKNTSNKTSASVRKTRLHLLTFNTIIKIN